MSSFEQLGIVPIEKVNEIFVLSDPVVEPALRMRDAQLARSAFTAVAQILEKLGYIDESLVDSFILESEQKIVDLK